MPSEVHPTRHVPLATPFGRQGRLRQRWRGPLLSAVVHLGIVGALVWSGERAMEAIRNPGEGPGSGGGGGNRMFAVLLPSRAFAAPVPPLVQPEPDQLVVPVTPTTIPPTPPPDSTTVAATTPATSPAPGQGEGAGPGAGPGSGGGAGGGSGGGVGPGVGDDSGGAGGRVFPPQPQGIILPPTGAPGNLRGVRLTVRFEVSERGEVLSVEVEPQIRDRGYRNEFLERMRRYTFTPAYLPNGRPVRAVFPVQITL